MPRPLSSPADWPGFLLAVPLGNSPAPPGLAATLLGLPLAAALLLLLVRLGPPGRLPRSAGVGVAVMLVNLLAAGGIGQPGVAGSFWLLLALGLFPVPLAFRRVALASRQCMSRSKGNMPVAASGQWPSPCCRWA